MTCRGHCWRESLRDNAKYAWKHSNGAPHVWSGDCALDLSSLQNASADHTLRSEYGAHRRTMANR